MRRICLSRMSLSLPKHRMTYVHTYVRSGLALNERMCFTRALVPDYHVSIMNYVRTVLYVRTYACTYVRTYVRTYER